MAEELVEDTVSTKQRNYQSNIVKDVFLGICVFVGINLWLLLVGHILGNLFWKIDYSFFNGSPYYVGIFDMVKFAIIFLINVVVFIFLIIKRPRMIIGVVAGIPVFMAALVLIWLAVCLFVVVAWYALLFLNAIGLI